MLATGVDLVRVERVARLCQRRGEQLRDRLFTEREWNEARGRPESLAVRFAAKEAVAKAMGTGFRNGLRWQEIEVCLDDLGAPRVCLYGRAGEAARALGWAEWSLSLSHTAEYAVAFFVASGSEGKGSL